MKKTTIAFLVTGLLFVTGLTAQTIQEGLNHLNSGRPKSAIINFEKMIAVNPNNIEAIYWLGQAYLDNEEIAGARIKAARELYEKGLQSSVNAPLLLVGMGHVELLEHKTTDARQRFETALTMTRTKKGDDQNILVAVGRANVDAKSGDFNYAIEKLKAAADKGEKSPEILLQLGNAYRKANPGQGGGDAFENYKKALSLNPSFSIANLRLAKLFESQKNWELVLQYLNEAVTKDPKFTAGYYELFYYYFFRAKFPEAEEQLKKYIESKLPESDIQDDYLYAQLGWARKDYEGAIAKGEHVVTTVGDKTKPKVYRLLADAYYQKGDYQNAKKYSDLFFLKKNPEDVILPDYEIKALVQSKTGGTPEDIYNTYMAGVALDTTADAKVGYIKKGVAYFKENKLRDKEALMLQKLIEIKPKPTINDYFDLTLAYYFSANYGKSREEALRMVEKYPDQVYGYEWAYNSSITVDTLKKDSIAVPDALKLYGFSQKDTAKFRKQYINSVRYLAAYYINVAKDKDKSLEFFAKWLEVDSANAPTIQPIIEQIKKMPSRPAATTPSGNPVPVPGKSKSASVKKTKINTAPGPKTVVARK
ncbi:MAG: tetratricopeptide repeat protein [Chitinophagaceae bacterium]